MKWTKFKRQLLADKRKLSLIVILSALMLLLWGRLLLKNVPQTAVADPNQPDAASLPFMQDAPTAAKPDKPVRPPVRIEAFPRVQRELFAFDSDRYPRVPDAEIDAPVEPKSDVESTDEMLQQRNRRQAVREAARQLTLQSTLMGSPARAMINGVLLEPGEMIAGFELKTVRNRQVVLARDGVEVTLEM